VNEVNDLLEVDKNYQCCKPFNEDELCRSGIFVWNITRIHEFIKENKSEFKPTKIDVAKYRHSYSRINEHHLPSVDLSKPIILAEINPMIEYSVIDGHHRIEKAYREGIKNLYAYKLNVKQQIQFFTSVDSYKAFITYWNEKWITREKYSAYNSMYEKTNG
jgi:hypothetical protein